MTDTVQVFDKMIGAVATRVSGANGGEELQFVCTDGAKHLFYHGQDCCESVTIEDICGDLADLVGSPLLMAEQFTHEGAANDPPDGTWTFYRFATAKGCVTVRWLGVSNGYYSESVDYSYTAPQVAS